MAKLICETCGDSTRWMRIYRGGPDRYFEFKYGKHRPEGLDADLSCFCDNHGPRETPFMRVDGVLNEESEIPPTELVNNHLTSWRRSEGYHNG